MIDHVRIVLDSAVLAGKPVIRGTRLSVDFVIGLMADGWTEGDILRNYPGITHDDVAACRRRSSLPGIPETTCVAHDPPPQQSASSDPP